jgi:hypothetical protein
VIRIDWTNIRHDNKEDLTIDLSDFLKSIAADNGITLTRRFSSSLFSELIQALHLTTGKKVVVLIDEYDRPFLDTMDTPEAEGVRRELHQFYGILKGSDDHLRFVFMTGITKVAKLSIFSALNSLKDISLVEQYATICGYTQEELESNFAEHIEATAAHMGVTREDLLENIRTWYDGYTWDGKTPLYNPFSTLRFFKNREISGYWFSTGTPTFLIERLKRQHLAKTVLEPMLVDVSTFDAYDPGNISDIALLYQTGYLTIKEKQLTYGIPKYTLAVPNLEVKAALMEHLLSAYTQYP